jgi:hypothetical protein
MANRENSATGKFRKAVLDSGFIYWHGPTIFNDSHRRKNFRRLKLWNAEQVFDAPQHQQQLLEKKLRDAFGSDIIGMYFIEGNCYFSKSLCIRLKM